MPGTVTGRPASRELMRATFRLSSPAPLESPIITSSISEAEILEIREITSLIADARRSSGRIDDRPPK